MEIIEAVRTSQKKDHVFQITEIAIYRVVNIKVPGFSDEQNLSLYNTHKDILKMAKEENQGNEVLFVQKNDFLTDAIKILGTKNKVSYSENIDVAVLKSDSYAEDLVISHNHPSMQGFSFADIAIFIIDEYIGTSTVVTNQGQIYILHKNSSFDYNKARELLNILYDNYELEKFPDDEERQINAARDFIKKSGKVGVWYEKTN